MGDMSDRDIKQFKAWQELDRIGDFICFRILEIGFNYRTVVGVHVQCGN